MLKNEIGVTEIAYYVKIINSIKMVYEKRYENFRAIYTHKTAQAIDLMMQDCLVKADCKFDFLSCLNDPQKYVHLTDLIVQRINKSKDPNLKASQQILERVHTRNLYQFVDGFHLKKMEWGSYFKEQDIADCSDGAIKAEDIILLSVK